MVLLFRYHLRIRAIGDGRRDVWRGRKVEYVVYFRRNKKKEKHFSLLALWSTQYSSYCFFMFFFQSLHVQSWIRNTRLNTEYIYLN